VAHPSLFFSEGWVPQSSAVCFPFPVQRRENPTMLRMGIRGTHHVYDLAGRQTSVTHGYGTANASITSYVYDAAGHKVSETDALNHTTTYTYDADGGWRTLKSPGGPSFAFF
jgi:YD repeat-containing protein